MGDEEIAEKLFLLQAEISHTIWGICYRSFAYLIRIWYSIHRSRLNKDSHLEITEDFRSVLSPTYRETMSFLSDWNLCALKHGWLLSCICASDPDLCRDVRQCWTSRRGMCGFVWLKASKLYLTPCVCDVQADAWGTHLVWITCACVVGSMPWGVRRVGEWRCFGACWQMR